MRRQSPSLADAAFWGVIAVVLFVVFLLVGEI